MHEQKKCPRCERIFQCKAGSIVQCDCSTVSLSSEERAWIEERFSDCLCLHCLKEVKNNHQRKQSHLPE